MFGSDNSSDSLIFRMAIYCAVIFITINALFAALLPAATSGYDYDDFIKARDEVMAFTGDSMVNSTPWKLEAVYTAYQPGNEYAVDSSGFLYGSSVVSYAGIGSSIFKMDHNQKSYKTLDQKSESVEVTEKNVKWIYSQQAGPLKWIALPIATAIANITDNDIDVYTTTTSQAEYPAWDHSGYRFYLKPMLPFRDGETSSSTDGGLSIVWYRTNSGIEGISGGLVLYDTNRAIVGNVSAIDIISDYNTSSALATKYDFVFEGTHLNLNIRFDPEVLSGSIPINQAWTDGAWSLAITSESAGNFLDLKNSNSFTSSLGSMIETFQQIFFFDVPNIDNPLYSVLLWVFCVLPGEIALMLFLKSVFGMAGVGAGILGNLLAFVL